MDFYKTNVEHLNGAVPVKYVLLSIAGDNSIVKVCVLRTYVSGVPKHGITWHNMAYHGISGHIRAYHGIKFTN